MSLAEGSSAKALMVTYSSRAALTDETTPIWRVDPSQGFVAVSQLAFPAASL